MFTGLIAELGAVTALDKGTEGARLSVKSNEIVGDAAIGDSIAVNGVCLTVSEIRSSGHELSFDVSLETLQYTNIGSLKSGDRVNLEPSLMPSSKMGGHFVTGHVEGIGRIRSKIPYGKAVRIEIGAPANILKYLIEKGSVAVDGISLTVARTGADFFGVVIIPHTAKVTTLGFKAAGDFVNLEPDILGKYVERFFNHGRQNGGQSDASLLSSLQQAGFLGSQ
ncbi:MAG: riboflavin synthase [Nitrospirae bacterium]|nr:riboflavin synthase [Nitrospirota bacterium]